MKAKLREYIEEKTNLHIPKNVRMNMLIKVKITKIFKSDALEICYCNNKQRGKIKYAKITNNNFYIVDNKYFIIIVENDYYSNNERYLVYRIQNKKMLQNIKSCIVDLLI